MTEADAIATEERAQLQAATVPEETIHMMMWNMESIGVPSSGYTHDWYQMLKRILEIKASQ